MNRYASIVCLCAGILIPRPASALDIDLGAQFGLGGDGSNPVWVGLNAGVNYESGGFAFDWLLHADSSGQFQSPFHGDYFGDFDVQIAHGFFSYASDPFSLVLGAKPSFDVVASPYSLFMSGRGLSIPGFAFSYQDERFLFREQWMLLGKDSDYGWPDRGAVIKTYAAKLGAFRFGFQDASVVAGTVFDPLDALIPAPSFLIQYVALAPGRPWSADSQATGTNKNSIMGFFADYSADGWYAYAQILVDDFDMNRFYKPDGPLNPDKLAFSLGGHYDLSGIGRLSAYLGMALKYAFQAFGMTDVNTMYGYTRWPVTAYKPEASGEWQAISMEQNMLGYRNGENDLSLLFGWEGRPWAGSAPFGELDAAASLELSITGAQSPGNPWHEYTNWQEAVSWQNGVLATEFLDGRLRTRLRISADASIPLGKFLLGASFVFGYEWNSMELQPAGDPSDPVNGQPILRPGSAGRLLWACALSAIYTLSF